MSKKKKPTSKSEKRSKAVDQKPAEDHLDQLQSHLQNACDLYYAAVALAVACLDMFDDAPDKKEAFDDLIEAHVRVKNALGKQSELRELRKKSVSSDNLLEICDFIINESVKIMPPLRWVNWRMLSPYFFLYVSDIRTMLNIYRSAKDNVGWAHLAFPVDKLDASLKLTEYAVRDHETMLAITSTHPQHPDFRGSRGLSIHSFWADLSPIKRLELLAHDYWQTCDEFAHLKFDHIDTGKWAPPKESKYGARPQHDAFITQLKGYEIDRLKEEAQQTSSTSLASPFDTLQRHRDLALLLLQDVMLENHELFFGPDTEPYTDAFVLPHPDECNDIGEWHKRSLDGPVAALQRRINIAKNREAISDKSLTDGAEEERECWLRLSAIAQLLFPDDPWQEHKEIWDRQRERFYKGIRRRQKCESQAFCYDAWAFLIRLRKIGHIGQAEYMNGRKQLAQAQSEPCDSQITYI